MSHIGRALRRSLAKLLGLPVEQLERLGELLDRAEAAESRSIRNEQRADERFDVVGQDAQAQQQAIVELQHELDSLREVGLDGRRRLDTVEGGLGKASDGIDAAQRDFDRRCERLAADLAQVQSDLTTEMAHRVDTAGEHQDRMLHIASERADLLRRRLFLRLEELAGLVERMLRKEPLPAPAATPGLAAALDAASLGLVDAFRGDESEISQRLEVHLERLIDAAPVLDLGCGRGELLILLREQGVKASGVEPDEALAQACIRRGLEVEVATAQVALARRAEASLGAITAMHLFEHLPAVELQRILAEARRCLEPGGILLVECPNPHNLRMGACFYWKDPTHLRPLLPETLELFVKAAGLELVEIVGLHPSQLEDRLAPLVDDGSPALKRLAEGLDGMLSGPRDFALIARRPA